MTRGQMSDAMFALSTIIILVGLCTGAVWLLVFFIDSVSSSHGLFRQLTLLYALHSVSLAAAIAISSQVWRRWP